MQEEDELDLSYIEGLDPQITELIQQMARDKAVLNRKHAKKALHTYDGLSLRPVIRCISTFIHRLAVTSRVVGFAT